MDVAGILLVFEVCSLDLSRMRRKNKQDYIQQDLYETLSDSLRRSFSPVTHQKRQLKKSETLSFVE